MPSVTIDFEIDELPLCITVEGPDVMVDPDPGEEDEPGAEVKTLKAVSGE